MMRGKHPTKTVGCFLYIFEAIAENNIMNNVAVYGGFAGAVFLLFPVFLTLDGYMDLSQNKLFFSLKIFKAIKIFGGYIVFKGQGEFIHISDKKAFYRPYADMKNDGKKLAILKGFQVYSFRTTLEAGDENYPSAAFCVIALTQLLAGFIYPPLKRGRDFLRLKSGALLVRGGDSLKITIRLVAVFNQLSVTLAFIRSILEEVVGNDRKRKA